MAASSQPVTVQVARVGSFTFTATVRGTRAGQPTALTWSVQEGASGGTVDSSGHYTAPTTEGIYHVVATSVADITRIASASIGVSTFVVIPVERRTTWNPRIAGGIPSRTTVCATVDAASYG